MLGVEPFGDEVCLEVLQGLPVDGHGHPRVELLARHLNLPEPANLRSGFVYLLLQLGELLLEHLYSVADLVDCHGFYELS